MGVVLGGGGGYVGGGATGGSLQVLWGLTLRPRHQQWRCKYQTVATLLGIVDNAWGVVWP